MTRKHYIEIANIFNANDTDEGTILDFCDYAKEDNPNFNKKAFLTVALAGKLIVANATPSRLTRMIEGV